MADVLYEIEVNMEWAYNELDYYSANTGHLDEDQVEEIIDRLESSGRDEFADWFRNNRSNDYDTVMEALTDALCAFINHKAGDILPEPM